MPVENQVAIALGRHAFEEFVGAALTKEYGHAIRDADIGPLRCYRRFFPRPIPALQGHALGFYVLDYMPLEPFVHLGRGMAARPSVADTVRNVASAQEALGSVEVFAFMTGLTGLTDDELDERVYQPYRDLLNDAGFRESQLLLGSADTVMRHPTARVALVEFLATYADGLSIELRDEGLRVEQFVTSRIITSGVTRQSREPFERVRPIRRTSVVVDEMERLLRTDPTERTIEEFLRASFREVFGFKYDQVATQLWLSLPAVDLTHRNRRADVFLRNAVTRDWELVELKRSNVRLTGTHRDMPVLSRQVHMQFNKSKTINGFFNKMKCDARWHERVSNTPSRLRAWLSDVTRQFHTATGGG